MTLSNHEENLERWYADDAKYQLRSNYSLNENSIIFDAGAYTGSWALEMTRKHNCRVYAFEPVKEFFNELVLKSKNTKIIPFNFGLGGTSRQEKICVSKDGSSIFLDGPNTETITIQSILEFIESHNLNKIDLLKINIEGGEYELLELILDKNKSELFTNIQIQFHPCVENYHSRRETIQNKLSLTHTQTYNYDYIWENWTVKS